MANDNAGKVEIPDIHVTHARTASIDAASPRYLFTNALITIYGHAARARRGNAGGPPNDGPPNDGPANAGPDLVVLEVPGSVIAAGTEARLSRSSTQ